MAMAHKLLWRTESGPKGRRDFFWNIIIVTQFSNAFLSVKYGSKHNSDRALVWKRRRSQLKNETDFTRYCFVNRLLIHHIWTQQTQSYRLARPAKYGNRNECLICMCIVHCYNISSVNKCFTLVQPFTSTLLRSLSLRFWTKWINSAL